MKKLILLVLTAVMMTGCNLSIPYKNQCDPNKDYIDKTTTVYLDSCEYYMSSTYRGDYVFTHKGNCKFCTERRKQELKELAEQLNK